MRLRDLRASVEARRARADCRPPRTPPGAWIEHFAGVVARLESLMTQLDEMEDYTPGFLIRYGMAFFWGWGVCARRGLSFNALRRVDAGRKSCGARPTTVWILTLPRGGGLGTVRSRWPMFSFPPRRYPGAPELPLTLFLIANAYQQKGAPQCGGRRAHAPSWMSFAGHRLTQRWIFARGFNQLFTEAMRGTGGFWHFPAGLTGALMVDKRALWHASAGFFERQNERALDDLQALERRFPAESLPFYSGSGLPAGCGFFMRLAPL